ncbi:MAG: isoprenoid biosynthesis glyoxalase ElbB [Verrucomicrobia bacterium]|nr:isoprenoid biosynthesis glyoxalase ElbB [Verrucomicrobiota bacterium]
MSKVALILSGCGVFDGSEINESVLCLLALSQKGDTYECFAPQGELLVVDHLTRKPTGEKRSILKESARIARGHIRPLEELDPSHFDAILMPGGFGAACNLSTYATDEEECEINPNLKKILISFHQAKKPIGATCISPALIARVFQGKVKLYLTLGSKSSNISLAKMEMSPIEAKSSEVVADEENRVYTTPCYMASENLAEMFQGVKKLVAHL